MKINRQFIRNIKFYQLLNRSVFFFKKSNLKMVDFSKKNIKHHFAPEPDHESLVLMVAKAAYTRALTAYLQKSREGAQWLSGRVLDSRPKGCWFEPHRCHCVVSLSRTRLF